MGDKQEDDSPATNVEDSQIVGDVNNESVFPASDYGNVEVGDTAGGDSNQDSNPPNSNIRIFDVDPVDESLRNSVLFDDALPLLDLDELWKDVFDASDESTAQMKALELCSELKHYFWNQVISEERKQNLKRKETVDLFGATVEERIAFAKKTENQEEEDESEVPNLNSVFGEALLFKLRCDDKKPKKDTPKMTPEEDLEFMRKLLENIENTQKESNHFQIVVDLFAMEMYPYFYAKLLGASEERKPELGEVSKSLLLYCANYANPREMDLVVRSTISKISTTHYEGSVFHSLCDMVEVWGLAISRIPRKRSGFLQKLLQNQERMLMCGQAHRTAYYFDEGHDIGGFDERIDNVMISAFTKLLDAQEKQWKENEHMHSIVGIHGALKETRVICQLKKAQKESFRQRDDESDLQKPTMDDPARPAEEQVVDDWLLERQFLLVSALNTLREVVYKITVPSDDEDNEVKKLRRRHVTRMNKLVDIMRRLGWTTPLRAVQLSSKHLSSENIHPDGTTFEQGLGPVLKFAQGTKYTALSLISVSCYFYAAMRKPGCGANKLFEFTLDGTGFDLLEEKEALYNAIPFIMSLLSLTPKVPALGGAYLTNLFLDRCEFDFDAEDVLLWRFGLNQSGRHVTVEGLAMHVCRLVERVDDQNRATREFVYQTFQKILSKIRSPGIRFSLVNELISETGRIAVAAQLITELKDVLMYGDRMEEQGKWEVEENEKIKTRFVESLMPRYFMPRKDSLAVLSPIVALGMASMLLAIRDKRRSSCEMLEARKKFMIDHLNVAKEVVRALCSCAEHDMRSIPEKLLKTNMQKRNHYESARQTLNEGITIVSAMERTLVVLKEGSEPGCKGCCS